MNADPLVDGMDEPRFNHDACEDVLKALAPVLAGMVQSPDARPAYDVLSDALVWPDERAGLLPAARRLKIQNWSIVRYLWAYRTTLILENPDEQLRFLWDRGLELFPSWPAFDPRRQSTHYRRVYLKAHHKCSAQLDEIERELDEPIERPT